MLQDYDLLIDKLKVKLSEDGWIGKKKLHILQDKSGTSSTWIGGTNGIPMSTLSIKRKSFPRKPNKCRWIPQIPPEAEMS